MAASGVSLEVETIATNANGVQATATSTAVATVPTPTIAITSGLSNNTPRAGTSLQATVSFSNGDSAATPITYTWLANGSPEQSGTSSTYTPTEANLGTAITVDASFTDLFGEAILDTSSATGAVLDALPTVTTPTIAGIAQVGQTLTASATATPADDTLTFDWFSSANNFASPIATGSTFEVTSTGVSLEVEAIATNANGVQATATSAQIAAVPAPTPAINYPRRRQQQRRRVDSVERQVGGECGTRVHSLRLQGRRDRRFHRQRY